MPELEGGRKRDRGRRRAENGGLEKASDGFGGTDTVSCVTCARQSSGTRVLQLFYSLGDFLTPRPGSGQGQTSTADIMPVASRFFTATQTLTVLWPLTISLILDTHQRPPHHNRVQCSRHIQASRSSGSLQAVSRSCVRSVHLYCGIPRGKLQGLRLDKIWQMRRL